MNKSDLILIGSALDYCSRGCNALSEQLWLLEIDLEWLARYEWCKDFASAISLLKQSCKELRKPLSSPELEPVHVIMLEVADHIDNCIREFQQGVKTLNFDHIAAGGEEANLATEDMERIDPLLLSLRIAQDAKNRKEKEK